MIKDTSPYFSRMLDWYLNQCNGEWEKQFGIEIDTVDNPGWLIRIDLTHAPLEEKEFTKIRNDITEDNWIHCWIRERQFQGCCSPSNLVEMIKIFVLWSENYCSFKKQVSVEDSILHWLEKWYQSQCNGDWEHRFGVRIQSLANAKWGIRIHLQETDYEDRAFQQIIIYHSDEAILCDVEQEAFKSQCNSYDLGRALQIFCNWIEGVLTWQSILRFDGVGKGHLNTISHERIFPPHVHDPSFPGGIRRAKPEEIPKRVKAKGHLNDQG